MPAGHTKRGEQTQHTSNTALRGARPPVTQARFVKKTGAEREREKTHLGGCPVVRRRPSRGHAVWVGMLQKCQPTTKPSATCLSRSAGLEYGVDFVDTQPSSDQAETPVQAAAKWQSSTGPHNWTCSAGIRFSFRHKKGGLHLGVSAGHRQAAMRLG